MINNKHYHKKHLGQNFLINEQILDNIVNLIDIENKIVIEIGPGEGALTKKILLKNPKKLILIEKDKDLLFKLNQMFNINEKIFIINEDALKIKIKHFYDLYGEKCIIISNLPYNVGTLLTMNWIQEYKYIEEMTLMFQKEVADRIRAKEKTKDYGRISVLIQSRCIVEKKIDVNAENFYPKPKVNSTVINIKFKSNQIFDEDYNKIDNICKIFFINRRKTMLSVINKINKDNKYNDLITKINNFNNKNIRIEELSPHEILNLVI